MRHSYTINATQGEPQHWVKTPAGLNYLVVKYKFSSIGHDLIIVAYGVNERNYASQISMGEVPKGVVVALLDKVMSERKADSKLWEFWTNAINHISNEVSE